jgi:arsenite transporter
MNKSASAFTVAAAKAPSLGAFERYLTLWVALCIVAGVAIGQALPGLFRAIGAATVAQVNLPVAGWFG